MISARDEGLHLERASGELWREGFYFDWHDEEGRIAGVVGMGIRPLQGVYEPYVVLFRGDRVYFRVGRYPLEGDPLRGSFLRLEAEEPLRRWTVRFETPLLVVPKGTDLREVILRDDVERVEGRAEVRFDALTPCYRYRPEELIYLGRAQEHYEQGMRVSGQVVLEGKRIAFDGWGARDHTWGERDWARAEEWVWLTVQWPDRVVQVALGWEEGRPVPGGFLWTAEGGVESVDEVAVTVKGDGPVAVDWAEVSVRTREGTGVCFEVRPVTHDLFTLHRDERRWVQVAHHVARVWGEGMSEVIGMFERTLGRPAPEL